jgi:hypothetical protein
MSADSSLRCVAIAILAQCAVLVLDIIQSNHERSLYN